MSDAVDAPIETISFSRILRAIGPAIIVASVVLGPGSILINSKVGSTFGYGMIWVLLLSTTMMICTVILSAVIGVSYPSTPLVELRQRLGGGFALTAGLSMFLITSGFQFSNNLAVMAVVEQAGLAIELGTTTSAVIATGVIVLANLGLVYVLYGSARPYKVIERSMMVMVGMMLIGFLVNLIFVKPSVASVVKGMVPGWTEMPAFDGGVDYMLLLGLVGTTFSVAGAFYQGYAVREKGWTRENVSNGVIDSVVGIGVLGLISLMIMVTSATALRGADLKTLTDVAGQLEPLLGQKASVMFAMGILAGACSSLLVNALIGGTVFSDGLGFDASIKEPWPKALTVACLGFGMVTAIAMTWTSFSKVTMIVTAQAMTVVALPMIAFGMLALAWNLEKSFYRVYYRIFAVFTLCLTIFFAVRMVWSLWEKAVG